MRKVFLIILVFLFFPILTKADIIFDVDFDISDYIASSSIEDIDGWILDGSSNCFTTEYQKYSAPHGLWSNVAQLHKSVDSAEGNNPLITYKLKLSDNGTCNEGADVRLCLAPNYNCGQYLSTKFYKNASGTWDFYGRVSTGFDLIATSVPSNVWLDITIAASKSEKRVGYQVLYLPYEYGSYKSVAYDLPTTTYSYITLYNQATCDVWFDDIIVSRNYYDFTLCAGGSYCKFCREKSMCEGQGCYWVGEGLVMGFCSNLAPYYLENPDLDPSSYYASNTGGDFATPTPFYTKMTQNSQIVFSGILLWFYDLTKDLNLSSAYNIASSTAGVVPAIRGQLSFIDDLFNGLPFTEVLFFGLIVMVIVIIWRFARQIKDVSKIN